MQNQIKLAIHHDEHSFSQRWIEYCEKQGIPYKTVNCFQSDIIGELYDCHGLMWHWAHWDHKAQLFARQLTYSLEMMGKKVFPDSKTCWHYDDKLGQKYLLEAIRAPLVPTYVFYDKQQALAWADATTYPKIFKLRGGAGSLNVKLVPDKARAKKLIKKAFGRGFKASSRLHLFRDRIWQLRRDRTLTAFYNLRKGIGRLVVPTDMERNLPIERAYAYFQEFIPNNDHDIRVIVIDNKAFALKRMVRSNDFRASGSGKIIYDRKQIPLECVSLAFQTAQALQSQSLAFDFVSGGTTHLIVEISYAFSQNGYDPCPGYWDDTMNWHSGAFIPQGFMVDKLCKDLENAHT